MVSNSGAYVIREPSGSEKERYANLQDSLTFTLGYDNVSGKPFILELVPQEISDAAGKGVAAKGNTAVYRIPSICTVKLLDGVNLLLQDRVAVYQLGREAYFPLSK